MNNPRACPHCGVSPEEATKICGDGSPTPTPGAISICAECLRIGIFESGGILRHLTDKEMHAVVTSDAWSSICAAQRAIGIFKKKRRRGQPPPSR